MMPDLVFGTPLERKLTKNYLEILRFRSVYVLKEPLLWWITG